MDISEILRCIKDCGNAKAMEELRDLFVFQNDVYTFLRGIEVPYRQEAMYTRLVKDLSAIGLQLIKFFGG